MLGKNGSSATMMPSTICTRGVDTLGMNRLMNEESTTAATTHRMSSSTATVPPLWCVLPRHAQTISPRRADM